MRFRFRAAERAALRFATARAFFAFALATAFAFFAFAFALRAAFFMRLFPRFTPGLRVDLADLVAFPCALR